MKRFPIGLCVLYLFVGGVVAAVLFGIWAIGNPSGYNELMKSVTAFFGR